MCRPNNEVAAGQEVKGCCIETDPSENETSVCSARETHRPTLNRQSLLQYYTEVVLKERELRCLKSKNKGDFSHFSHVVNEWGWFYIAECYCLHFNLSSVTFSRARDDEDDLKLLIPGRRANQEGQMHLKPKATLAFNFKTTGVAV